MNSNRMNREPEAQPKHPSTTHPLAVIATAAGTWTRQPTLYWTATHAGGVAEIVLPPGVHEIDRPIDLGSTHGITLRGPGAVVVPTWSDARAAIDCTGAVDLAIRDIVVAVPETREACGHAILLARRPPAEAGGVVESSNHIVLERVRIEGRWSRAGVAILAAEHVTLRDCRLYSLDDAPALLLANASPWEASWPAASTMQVVAVRDCFLRGDKSVVELHANRPMILSDIVFDGGGGSCGAGADAAVRIFTVAGAQPQMIAFNEQRWETEQARNWLKIVGPANVGGLSIRGGSMYCRERFIDARGVYLVGLTVDDPFVWAQAASDWGVQKFVMRPNFWGWESVRPLIEAGSYDEPVIDLRTTLLAKSDAAAGVWHPTVLRVP